MTATSQALDFQAPDVAGYDPIRDLRHMAARAAGDLADWLVHLELEGKADRTIYSYSRYVAELLRAHPDKRLDEFTHTDINDLLRRTPKDSRHIVRSVYNRLFEWAVFDQRLDVSPMARVPKMPQHLRSARHLHALRNRITRERIDGMSIIEDRLALLDTVTLLRGGHEPDGEFCVMELAAYVAGEAPPTREGTVQSDVA